MSTSTSDILSTLNKYRQSASAGRAPIINGISTPDITCRVIEWTKGKLIKILNYEPDAASFRAEYYYNAKVNLLYQREWIQNDPKTGALLARWQTVSIPLPVIGVPPNVAAAHIANDPQKFTFSGAFDSAFN